MQTVKTILFILICAASLGACGLRGPLYLEEETPPTLAPATGQDSAPGMDEAENSEKDEKDEKKKTVSP